MKEGESVSFVAWSTAVHPAGRFAGVDLILKTVTVRYQS